MSNVRVLQLIAGTDILADVMDYAVDTLHLKNPVVIMAQPAGPDKMSIGFMPFCPYTSGKTINIQKSAVVLNEEPNAELTSEYNRRFGSGLVIAAAGSIPPTDGNGKGGLLNTRIL